MRVSSVFAFATLAVFCAGGTSAAPILRVATIAGEDILQGRRLLLDEDGKENEDNNKGCESCYLNRFRTMSIKEGAAKMKEGFGRLTVTSVVSNLLCMVIGGSLCFFGYKLLEYILLISSFLSGYIVFFFVVSEIMTLVGRMQLLRARVGAVRRRARFNISDQKPSQSHILSDGSARRAFCRPLVLRPGAHPPRIAHVWRVHP